MFLLVSLTRRKRVIKVFKFCCSTSRIQGPSIEQSEDTEPRGTRACLSSGYNHLCDTTLRFTPGKWRSPCRGFIAWFKASFGLPSNGPNTFEKFQELFHR